ncbi:MAG: TRAP transporter small permease subunit [Calditrichaeota bacterium]|nr:MAG: TRAP transporter small permease subunit [Calditrichota bacterium]
MRFLRWYCDRIDRLNQRIGSGVAWLTTALVLVVCYDVFTRYLLRESSVAVQEMEWHLFAFIFLLGAAYTLKADRHVRVDVFYVRLSPRLQAWVNFLGSVLFLIPFSIMVILTSWDYVWNSFLIGEKSPDPGGLPARYILKAAIPVGFGLLLLQGMALAFRSLLTILEKSEPDSHTEESE